MSGSNTGVLLDDLDETITQAVAAVEAIRFGLEDLVGAFEEDAMDAEDRVQEAMGESRSMDLVWDWVDSVVRETEGLMMDGESPGAILVRLIDELTNRPSFHIPSMKPMSIGSPPGSPPMLHAALDASPAAMSFESSH